MRDIKLTFSDILIYLLEIILFIITGLIALRIILKLLGAQATPFVSWVYATSGQLINPFSGIFPLPTIQNGFVIEFAAIFALIIYLVLGFLIIEFIRSIVAANERRVRINY